MVSFYPGPSRLDPQLEHYMKDAIQSGILSQNHRSDAFMELYEETRKAACLYLDVPQNYSMYFVSSATECWEIVSQDLGRLQNLHLYNGSFGEKGFSINHAFYPDTTQNIPFDKEDLPPVKKYIADVIHLTQNETANGTQLPAQWISELRALNPLAFITVDATSSMSGQKLPMADTDVWFASVQKCFGLPSGMAVLFCSPRVVDYCKQNKSIHYNSIQQLELQFTRRQTTHTPNTLGIYLMHKVVSNRQHLSLLDKRINTQAQQWYDVIEHHSLFQPLIQNKTVRSNTVIAIKSKEQNIDRFKKYCLQQNYTIGNGYGTYKDFTFRIANFPSHQPNEISALQNLLISFQ